MFVKSLTNTNYLKLSIITINFNNLSGLKRTIDSVIYQDFENVEYIIIDGGSEDGSIDLIKQNSKYLTFWISEPDGGIADAFNKGLKYATGDYIGIINSGDTYQPNLFNFIVEKLILLNPDIICGNLGFIKDNKIIRIKKSKTDLINKYMSVCHPTVFFKKTIYQHLGGFSNDFKIAMDYDFILKAVSNGYKIESFNLHIANMEFGGISRANEWKGLYECFQIKNKYLGNKNLNISYLFFLAMRAFIKRILVKIKLYNEA